MPITFNSLRLGLIASSLILTACSERNADTPPASSSSTATPAWVLASAPADAQSVSAAKAVAKEGEQVVLRGRIGGRKAPITSDSPVFTVMDLEIPHCGENPLDACKTPWDYCCELPETITANSATVQVLDEDGSPFTQSLTAYGLAALDEVIVVGTIAPRANDQVLVVRATGVYRVGG